MATKGYGLAFLRIVDSQKWKTYEAKARALSQSYGAKLVAGGKLDEIGLYTEGDGDHQYHMAFLMEYPSLDRAESFYNDELYQRLHLPLRQEAAEGPFLITKGASRPNNMKGIVMATLRFTNREEMKKYDPVPSIEAYGGQSLFRTPSPAASDGVDGRYDFCVALAFPTAERAMEWMNSEEYKEMLDLRLANTVGPLAILDARELDFEL